MGEYEAGAPLAHVAIEPADFPFIDAVFRHGNDETPPELEARLVAELGSASSS